MSSLMIIAAVTVGIIGIVGSVVPGLPGPPFGWLGLLLMYFAGGSGHGGNPMSMSFLLIWLAITTVVTVLDYIVPAYFARLTGGSRYAGRGAVAGILVGMLIPPVGIIVGAIAGAFLSEMYYARKDAASSAAAALGAFFGFLMSTGLKLIVTGLMLYHIIDYI